MVRHVENESGRRREETGRRSNRGPEAKLCTELRRSGTRITSGEEFGSFVGNMSRMGSGWGACGVWNSMYVTD